MSVAGDAASTVRSVRSAIGSHCGTASRPAGAARA